jgi:hypothetical protein
MGDNISEFKGSRINEYSNDYSLARVVVDDQSNATS